MKEIYAREPIFLYSLQSYLTMLTPRHLTSAATKKRKIAFVFNFLFPLFFKLLVVKNLTIGVDRIFALIDIMYCHIFVIYNSSQNLKKKW